MHLLLYYTVHVIFDMIFHFPYSSIRLILALFVGKAFATDCITFPNYFLFFLEATPLLPAPGWFPAYRVIISGLARSAERKKARIDRGHGLAGDHAAFRDQVGGN